MIVWWHRRWLRRELRRGLDLQLLIHSDAPFVFHGDTYRLRGFRVGRRQLMLVFKRQGGELDVEAITDAITDAISKVRIVP